ncbi:hypothetical protein VPHK379_0012 [Vibrio phage K379]
MKRCTGACHQNKNLFGLRPNQSHLPIHYMINITLFII